MCVCVTCVCVCLRCKEECEVCVCVWRGRVCVCVCIGELQNPVQVCGGGSELAGTSPASLISASFFLSCWLFS